MPEGTRLAVIGAGVMGSAVLRGVLAAGTVDPADVIVTSHSPESAQRAAAAMGVGSAPDNASAVAAAEIVLLAVKPQMMGAVLPELREGLADGALVVTVAVGLPAAFYESRLAPGTPVVRAMPNTPSVIGQGVSAISPGAHAGPDHLDLAEALLAPTGLVVRVPEAQQGAVSAVSGSGPAYVFHLIDALAEAGTGQGLPRALALRLAAHAVAGAGAMAAAPEAAHPAVLREQVSSPGGTTLAALAELDDRAVRAAYVAAVRAAVRRGEDLARLLGA